MRIAYGYRRAEKDFAKADVETIYIDTPKSDRNERREMFQGGGMRHGDTLVLLAKGDLGYGRELKRMRERLEEMGVSIEYVEAIEVEAPTRPRGRPVGFNPTPDHDREIKEAWHDEDRVGSYAIKVAARRGYDIQTHHLKHRYGNRFPDNSSESGK